MSTIVNTSQGSAMLGLDDQAALRRYSQSGDPAAFALLISRYEQMVHATCRRVLNSRDDAADATQETFLKFARNAARIHGNVAAWLHACALGTAKDLVRHNGVRERAERAEVSAELADGPEDVRTWNEIAPLLDVALSELAEPDRDAVIGHFLAGRPQNELAKEAGISAGTMSRRIDRALDVLQIKLRQSGLAIAGTVGLAAALGVGGRAAEASLAGSIAKIALAEASLSGKRAAASGLAGLLGGGGKGVMVAAIGVIGLIGAAGTLMYAGGGRGSAAVPMKAVGVLAEVAAGGAPIATYAGLPKPTKASASFTLYDDRSDGKAVDVFSLKVTKDTFAFMAPADESGRRGKLVAAIDSAKSAVPAKPGKPGALSISIHTFDLEMSPDAPSLVGEQAIVRYSIKDGILRANVESQKKWGEDPLLWRRTTSSLEVVKEETDPSDPILGEWMQVPVWWSIRLEPTDIILSGGGAEYQKLNPKSQEFPMSRFRVTSWVQEKEFSRVEVICAANGPAPGSIGKRMKLLLRSTADGVQLSRHEFSSSKLNEWPTFDPKPGDEVRVQTFRKEIQ